MKNSLSFLGMLMGRNMGDLCASTPWIAPKYRIDGATTYNWRDLIDLKKPWLLDRPLECYYKILEKEIERALEQCAPYTVLRLNDGEAYFLQGKLHGNVIRRHLTNPKNYNPSEWRERLWRNNRLTFHISPRMRRLWTPVIGKDVMRSFFPMHAVYALVATRRLFQVCGTAKVGFVGAHEKLLLIEELLSYGRYREYLGIRGNCGFYAVPQTGACNEPRELTADLLTRMRTDPSDVYLVGMGIAKIYALPELCEELGGVFLDVGHGLDAIAGIVPKDKQFFGSWTNFKVSPDSYRDVEMLGQKLSTARIERFGVQPDVLLHEEEDNSASL